MRIRMTGPASIIAALVFAAGSSSEAGYTLSASGLNPTSATFGGTSFGFAAISPSGQSASVASNFNVINVSASSTTSPSGPADTGSFTLSDSFILTGTSGTESFTLSGEFSLISGSSGGIVSTFAGSIIDVSGGGYTVLFAGYAPPSPNSNGTSFNNGNISLTVMPTAVAEPSSIAMLGVGLVGVGGLASRRRMAKSTNHRPS